MDSPKPNLADKIMKAWPVIAPAFFLAVFWWMDLVEQHKSVLDALIFSAIFLGFYLLFGWGVSWSKNRKHK
jgi:hypothetical protein